MQYIEGMKYVVVFGLVLVVAALASAGVFMLRRPGSDEAGKGSADGRMAKALALRVALSVALFLLLLFAALMGWIKPGGVPLGR
ncbi:MAG: hypothetical protein RLZZ584_2263 [Pseudomonadota bacterium]|jgi:hypothetical protein